MNINSKVGKTTLVFSIFAAIGLTLSAVSVNQVAIAQDENATEGIEETERKITELAQKFNEAVSAAGLNLTLADVEDANITESLQALQDNPNFAALSEQFAQLSQDLGLDPTNLQDLEQVEGSTLEGLVQKLKDRIANSSASG